MAKPVIAKVFMSGRSQAVRLPKEFRLPGKEVQITRTDRGLLLEPIYTDPEEMWAAIDAISGGKFEIEIPPDEPAKPEDIFGESKW